MDRGSIHLPGCANTSQPLYLDRGTPKTGIPADRHHGCSYAHKVHQQINVVLGRRAPTKIQRRPLTTQGKQLPTHGSRHGLATPMEDTIFAATSSCMEILRQRTQGSQNRPNIYAHDKKMELDNLSRLAQTRSECSLQLPKIQFCTDYYSHRISLAITGVEPTISGGTGSGLCCHKPF